MYNTHTYNDSVLPVHSGLLVDHHTVQHCMCV